MTESDKLNARIALLDYARSKISEHIQFFISLILLIYGVNTLKVLPSELSIALSIFFLGPLFYMVGRTLYWTTFTTAVFLVKEASKEIMVGRRPENDEYSEYNPLWAYNHAVSLEILREKTFLGKIGRWFRSSRRLLNFSAVSGISAIIYYIWNLFYA